MLAGWLWAQASGAEKENILKMIYLGVSTGTKEAIKTLGG